MIWNSFLFVNQKLWYSSIGRLIGWLNFLFLTLNVHAKVSHAYSFWFGCFFNRFDVLGKHFLTLQIFSCIHILNNLMLRWAFGFLDLRKLDFGWKAFWKNNSSSSFVLINFDFNQNLFSPIVILKIWIFRALDRSTKFVKSISQRCFARVGKSRL